MKNSKDHSEKVVVVPVPPDGGYGWVIVFASFMLSMILDGICFTVGLYFNEFLDYYDGSKAETAWVGSVLNGMYMSIGPIVSCLCNYFGCRPVAFAGGVFTCISFVLATFSPNLTILTITFGAMAGIGFGLFYLPAIVMVGFYFEKRRALATGIAVCGSGIGGTAFAPLTRYLIDRYSWKGAILIIAGISLHSLVMTALLRPLVASVSSGEELDQLLSSNHSLKARDAQRKSKSSIDTERVYFCSLADFSPKTGRAARDVSVTLSCDHIWSGEASTRRKRSGVDVSRPEFRKDAFLSGSLARIPEFREGQRVRHRAMSEEPYVCSVTNLAPLESKAKQEKKESSGILLQLRRFRESLDLSILRSPTCLLYGASCTLCMLGFFVPFMYLPRLAVEHGFSAQEAATIISVMSFTNVIGRVVIGLISDIPRIDCILINNFSLVLGGIAIACIPHFPSMAPMIFSSILFGLAIAAFVSLRSIIMVELMGLEKLSSAFGFVTLCQGLSSFVGTPIAGALSDSSGNFHSAFYMAGATLVLSGVMCFPLRCVSVWEKRRSCRGTTNSYSEPQSDDDDLKLVDIPRTD